MSPEYEAFIDHLRLCIVCRKYPLPKAPWTKCPEGQRLHQEFLKKRKRPHGRPTGPSERR